MKSMTACGVDCSTMEFVAVLVQLCPAQHEVTAALRKRLSIMENANRRYLRKRGTRRLAQLLNSTLWKAPCRAALIFEVLNARVAAARVRASGFEVRVGNEVRK